MTEFVMPTLGADMEAGTLVAWHKKPGDTVARGDVIAEVETDKGIIEIEVFTPGVIAELLLQPGQKVPVGTVMARIGEAGEAPAATTQHAVPATPAATPAPQRITASPAARRRAEEMQIDLSLIRGTGPGGAIALEDVEKHAASAGEPAIISPETDRITRMRQTIAAAMARSKREIPHYYLATTIDMHSALNWLSQQNLARSVTERMLPGVMLIKAAALAVRQSPELNATWTGERVQLKDSIHVGVVISLRQGGIVVPAIHDTEKLSLGDLMKKLRDVTERARAGGLRSSELSDSTITITSLGDQGVESVFGVIYPPQVAIVGFGRVVERPWCVAGQVTPRPVVTATLSADHRVSDGQRGARLLQAIDRLLQEPDKL